MSLRDYLAAMPKAENHVHLEGSIQPETLLRLAERNRVQLPADTPEDLRALYRFTDFPHFIDIYLMIVGCLQTPEDFVEITYRFGENMARHNIRYAEVTWSPQGYVPRLFPFGVLLDAINEGRAKAQAEWGVQMRWIPDIIRQSPASQLEFVEWLITDEARAGGVVAMGLGGYEVGHPPEDFIQAFQIARDAGLPSNPHAGETAGAASIWGALRGLGATRIGHGVRAVEDPELVRYLVEHRIPLEVNPTSNLCLGVYPDYASHPLKALIEAGCVVTINSDDPPLFNTDLTQEYIHAVEDCGLSLEQLEQTALDAVRVSYLPESEKTALLEGFETSYRQLRSQYGL